MSRAILEHLSGSLLSVLVLAMTGCSSEYTPRERPNAENTGAAAQAIAWGAEDTGSDALDQMKRDVVVQVDDCTGTLISPQILITASHCMRGNSIDGPRTTTAPTIRMGESLVTFLWSKGYDVIPYINRPMNVEELYEAATDVAVVRLQSSFVIAGSAPGSTPHSLADYAIITRPSFSSGETGTGGMAGFALENITHGNRQVGWATWAQNDDEDARYFETHGAALRGGDSGGPLFTVRPDGTRDLIGVASQMQAGSNMSRFADITSDLIANWIRDLAQDRARSTKWHLQHGTRAGDYWLGEVDYTGSCNYTIDGDCDHWTDAHDNCPDVWNVDQLDSHDDGVGDACRVIGVDAVALADDEVQISVRTPSDPPPSFTIWRDGKLLGTLVRNRIYYDASTAPKTVYVYTTCYAKGSPSNPVCASATVRTPVPVPKSVSAVDEIETSTTTITWGSTAGPDGFEVEQLAATPGATWVKWSFGNGGTALARDARTTSAPTNGDYDTQYRVCALDTGGARQCSVPVKPSRQLCVVTASCRVHGKLVVPTDTDDPNTWCSDVGGVLTRQQSCSTSTPNP